MEKIFKCNREKNMMETSKTHVQKGVILTRCNNVVENHVENNLSTYSTPRQKVTFLA